MRSLSKTRVFLVRHGRSTFNEQGRYQGSSDDSVLIKSGWQASHRVGQALQRVAFDAIYTSPLQRAQQTLAAMLEGMLISPNRVSIYEDTNLREIDLPAWEGLPFQQVKVQYAEAYRCWKQRPHEFQMQSTRLGETGNQLFLPVVELYERAWQFLSHVLSDHRGQTVAVVSHGGTNHALISTALGLAVQQHHCLQQSNCGISLLQFPDPFSQLAELQVLNSTTHLNEQLPKLKEGKSGWRLILLPSEPVNVYQLHHLAKLLHDSSIQFCLMQDSNDIAAMLNILLNAHPAVVRLQSLPSAFSETWQAFLEQTPPSEQLVTVLAIASLTEIQQYLGQTIGLHHQQRWRLSLQPGGFSVVHCPGNHHRPILQALNVGLIPMW